MKLLIFTIVVLFSSQHLSAQPQNFEGIIDFSVNVKGKKGVIDEKILLRSLLESEESSVMVRRGNYKYISSIKDTWFIHSEKKEYLKFTGIDTLYFREYSDDTAKVISAEVKMDTRKIAGFDCKLIVISTTSGEQKYFYAPSLYNNPEYDKDNRIGRIDAFVRETSSMWLSQEVDTDNYTMTINATKVEQKVINDSVFILPDLPTKKFTVGAVLKEPVFTRTGGWIKYVSSNVNVDVGIKYLKIPRKETSATQTVKVSFIIDKTGKVTNATVTNPKSVHPKLADEALRVISSSPNWKPGTLLGEKTNFYYEQPVTFAVSK